MRIISHDKTELYSIAAFFPTLCLMIQNLIYSLIGEQAQVHIVTIFISTIPLLLAVYEWVTHNIIKVALSYFFVISICLLNFIIFPENRNGFWENLITLFFMCIPCFLNCSFISDESKFLSTIKIIGNFIFTFGCIVLIIKLMGIYIGEAYNMSYSYYMLLPALIYVYYGIKEKKGTYYFMSCICGFSMILLGSRGALISLLLFIVIIIFFSNNKILHKTIALALGIVIIAFSNKIIIIAYDIISRIGIKSRTMDLIRYGGIITYDSGRSEIRNKAINAIFEHPIVGNGIGSEWRIMGTYSHNIFLDIFLHGGLIFGSIFILIILIITIRAFMLEKDKRIFWLLFCYGAFPLIVSGSYLSNMNFWIFLGYCVHFNNYVFIRKRNLKNQVNNRKE